MRGRKPKPSKLKVFRGNPGKRGLNESEPQPAGELPKCPNFLSASAKARWKKLLPELARLGLITSVDGDSLAAYCQAWAEFEAATRELSKKKGGGRVVLGAAGTLVSHPAVAQQRTAMAQIRAFSALFGLDPSSRSRLRSPGQEEKDDLENHFAPQATPAGG